MARCRLQPLCVARSVRETSSSPGQPVFVPESSETGDKTSADSQSQTEPS